MKEGWPALVRQWKGALGKYGYVLLVIGVGALLLLWPGGGETETVSVQESGTYFDLEEFEARLEKALSHIEGAGEVSVVLTLESDGRQVLAQDRDTDGAGGGTSTTVTVGRGGGTEEVVPLQTFTPDFRGALVICPGGGEAQVRLRLVEAVSAVTGLGSDRISICTGNP
ncbi:stage III sporulation protein AG [Pseudoflavonifractor sp. AF19-9AC]|uniref:stage III sporulation protein AG n=1 Tax=Pseudoflavonifractor sp. AF19-9AC TaxID=2292244 RepID=UPI000E53D7EB|nr:stage III sporulation protein AG [Pseudoflavonifractor sp. AF19-9AC]RHR05622.1 stage III sporulation protein AG [Pseudoflavonifractor sp. AF19-9AC]